MEVDPFELRIQFKEILSHLTVSDRVILSTSEFCLANKTFHTDLYNCIIEHMQQIDTLSRINCLYVLDRICTMCRKAGFDGYGSDLELLKIVSLCCPGDDAAGDANVHNVKRSVNHTSSHRSWGNGVIHWA